MQGEPFLVYAPSRTPTIPTVYVRCPRCLYTISLCIYAALIHGWLYNSVEQHRDSVCQCRSSALERGAGWAISCLRSVAHAHDTYGVCTMSTVFVHHLAVYLCCADSRMIEILRTATLGNEFFNKKLIRCSRRMDAVAVKSDAVAPWKCTITDACRRLRTLKDADSRCVAFAPSACDHVKPYPSVTGPSTIVMQLSSLNSFQTEPEISRASYFDGTGRSPR